MARRPYPYLVKSVLSNRTAGRVTGWARFATIDRLVLIDLQGDFADDIRREKIILFGPEPRECPHVSSAMRGLALEQTGKVILMTAGRNPAAGLSTPRFEWCNVQGERVLLEPPADGIRIVGEPLLVLPRAYRGRPAQIP